MALCIWLGIPALLLAVFCSWGKACLGKLSKIGDRDSHSDLLHALHKTQYLPRL